MNYVGILIGLATFLIIGLFHPLVIKGEYYFGTKCWWAFLAAGLLFAALSLCAGNLYVSILSGVVSFSSFLGHTRSVRPAETRAKRLVSQESQKTEGL